MTREHSELSLQGNYAGAISRLVAFATDLGASWLVLVIFSAMITFTVRVIAGHTVHVPHYQIIAIVVAVAWGFIYFSYQWSLSGKTLGMALFGLKVVSAEGAEITSRQAVIRTITLPLSIVVFGLGLFGIVLRVDHRAWHDRFAKTCVIYDWDARSARLRWLARQSELPRAAQHPRASKTRES